MEYGGKEPVRAVAFAFVGAPKTCVGEDEGEVEEEVKEAPKEEPRYCGREEKEERKEVHGLVLPAGVMCALAHLVAFTIVLAGVGDVVPLVVFVLFFQFNDVVEDRVIYGTER